MSTEIDTHRYKKENDTVIIEVGIKNSRQLFNEKDPAPFRERDLDAQFVTYIVSAVEEFPVRTKMKVRVRTAEHNDLTRENISIIRDAIKNFFNYEAELAKANLRKSHRAARFFFMVGIITLIICLSVAQFVSSIKSEPVIAEILSVGFVIIGWVAMWHPIEALLYDWWPIREKRMYFDKIAGLNIDVVAALAPTIRSDTVN